jgi:hypothetical protein
MWQTDSQGRRVESSPARSALSACTRRSSDRGPTGDSRHLRDPRFGQGSKKVSLAPSQKSRSRLQPVSSRQVLTGVFHGGR